MYNYSSIKTDPSLDSSSGSAYELTSPQLAGCTVHQLTLVPIGGATGTVAISFRPVNAPAGYVATLYEADETTPRVIDLATPEPIIFPSDGGFLMLEAVILDCSGVTGSFDALLESR